MPADQNLATLLPMLAQFGIAGVWLWLLVKGVLVTNSEAERWRKAYEDERTARAELQRALDAQTERAAAAVATAELTAKFMDELRAQSARRELT
jgi:hypothetical protein